MASWLPLSNTVPSFQAPYTGQVTTNVMVPNSIIAASNSAMTRTAHYTRGGISNIQAVYAGWYVNVANGFLGQEVPTGSYTASFWVEYPVGTYTQIDNSITVATAVNTAGTNVNISIPANTYFYTWTYFTGGTFPFFSDTTGGVGTVLYTDESSNINTSGVATTPGTLTDNFTRRRRTGPVAIVGTRTGISVACIGDSRTAGTGDKADGSTNRGNLARAIGGNFDCINLGVGSDDPSMWIFGGANRRSLAKTYCTNIVDELGINLFNNRLMTGSSSFSYKARMQYIFNGMPYVMTTLEPKTSSTDSFASAVNQTVLLPNSATFNTSVRALSNFIELRTPVEDPNNLGKWISNGMANRETIDGLHPNTFGYQDNQATSGAVVTAIYNSPKSTQTQPSIDLTLAGTPTYDTLTPKFGSACLNGGFGYNFGMASGTIPQTLECWYKASAAGSGNGVYILGVGDAAAGASSPAFAIVNNTSGFAAIRDSGGTTTASAVSIIDGVWHHLALVLNSTTYTLYVDGTSAATRTFATTLVFATGSIVIRFNSNVGSPSAVPGSIDEVAYWNAQQYTTTFTPNSSPYVGNEANLIGVWHFDSTGAGVSGPALS
jgi:hypothetical protein